MEHPFGPTFDKTLEQMNAALVPAGVSDMEAPLRVYALQVETGQPLEEEAALDLHELLYEFSIGYSPANPTGTLLDIHYGASRAVIQQAIDMRQASQSPALMEGSLSGKQREQYLRMLVSDLAKWEYIMEPVHAYLRADLRDCTHPLRMVLDHINRLEIPYRVEHINHTDMLTIHDKATCDTILHVRNSLYQKIAVHNPTVIDVARHLTECRVSLLRSDGTDQDAGGK